MSAPVSYTSPTLTPVSAQSSKVTCTLVAIIPTEFNSDWEIDAEIYTPNFYRTPCTTNSITLVKVDPQTEANKTDMDDIDDEVVEVRVSAEPVKLQLQIPSLLP